MTVFSAAELEYLGSQRICRLATVGPDGVPHVVPVAYWYNADEDSIDSGGHNFTAHKKYRDVLANPKVALVVDDIVSVQPWLVRGVEVRGDAEVLTTGGEQLMYGFSPEMFRIRPSRVVSWGLADR